MTPMLSGWHLPTLRKKPRAGVQKIIKDKERIHNLSFSRLGIAAIHEGKRVRFFNAVDLVNQRQLEKQMDKTESLARTPHFMRSLFLSQ